jgi:hypothetical protein
VKVYQESEINDHLTCHKCKNKYNDPRLIDCGGSLCKACIDLLIIDDENRFKCPVCEDLHEIPANGYLKIENMEKLCSVKASQVSRGPQTDSLRAQLDGLKQNVNAFSSLIELGPTKINEHCNDLRREVDLSTDKLIESIKLYKMDLKARIDAYEGDSIAKYHISKEYVTRMEKLVKETNGVYSDSMDYLRKFEHTNEDLRKASAKLNNCQENLNHERGLFVNQIFSGHLLKFVENATQNNANLIGALEDDESQLVYQKQINQLKVYELEEGLYDESIVNPDYVRVQFLNNGNICIAFRHAYCEELHVSMLDSNFNKRCTEDFEIFNEFKLAKLKSSPILCLIDSQEDDEEDQTTIIKLDDDLVELNKITVEYKLKAVDGFESRLYCLSTNYNVNRLVYVYDKDLSQLLSIGQQDDLRKPFYISNTFKKMRVCEDYYVFLDGKQVVFVNRQKGMVEKKFNFDSFDFKLYGDGLHAFKYDGANSNLIKYDFNGNSQLFSLENANLSSKRKQNMKLVDCFNGRFIFLEKTDDDYF